MRWIRVLDMAGSQLRKLVTPPEAYARSVGVTLGQGCRIYIRSWGSEPFLISVGDRVTITSGVRILTHDGATWLVRNEHGVRRQRYRPVKIGNDVFIGVNSIIMPGVAIGDRVIIGAGSVVTKPIPSGTVWAGSPARFICDFDEYCRKVELEDPLDTEIAHVSDYRERVDLALKLSRYGE